MRDLRSKVEQLNLLKPNLWFYAAHLGHILALDVLGWFVMWYFGTGWLPYLTSAFLLLVVQVGEIFCLKFVFLQNNVSSHLGPLS